MLCVYIFLKLQSGVSAILDILNTLLVFVVFVQTTTRSSTRLTSRPLLTFVDCDSMATFLHLLCLSLYVKDEEIMLCVCSSAAESSA